MGELGRPRWTSFQKDSEALDWLQRAADDNNVDGLYYLGQLSFEKPNLQKHYYELGAAHGDARCMYFAATDWPNHVYFNAALAARGLLLDAVTDRLHRIVYMMTRFAIKPTDHNGFAMGRELEGYQSFWDQPVCEVLSSNALLSQCVETFLEISHRARRAALFTVVMLLEHRFPRDVARMIARIVYQSRENPELWDKKRATEQKEQKEYEKDENRKNRKNKRKNRKNRKNREKMKGSSFPFPTLFRGNSEPFLTKGKSRSRPPKKVIMVLRAFLSVSFALTGSSIIVSNSVPCRSL